VNTDRVREKQCRNNFSDPFFVFSRAQPKVLEFRGEAYGTNALAEFRRESLSDFSDFPPVSSFQHLNATQIELGGKFDRAF
jgi:hypothetical protein